jgi:DNA-binding LacI/PurR family transcriptional regulator
LRYTDVVKYLKVRIFNGDYQLRSIPSERQLAIETGVSYMTARKAVQALITEGLLVRDSSGMPMVNHGSGNDDDDPRPSLPIAFLVPTFNSYVVEWWQFVIQEAARRFSRKIRVVHYTHWDDVMLAQSLESFQGIFLLPISGEIPETAIERLRKAKRLVVVDEDLSNFGLPSIRMFPPSAVQLLLNHLESMGHQHIACLNIQQHSPVILQRIEQWQLWMNIHGLEGPLLDLSSLPNVPPHQEVIRWRFAHAYQIVKQWLEGDRQQVTALFCTTIIATIGAMRAINDHGLRVGEDVALCAANEEGFAPYLVPSITALETADVYPFLTVSLKWLTGISQHWRGPLLLQPTTPPLFIGESTKTRINLAAPLER